MPSIQVAKELGPICVKPTDGATLCALSYDALYDAKRTKDQVVLDFTGVKYLTSTFLNSAIGCLFENYPIEFLLSTLSFTGLDQVDSELASLVIKNATKHSCETEEERELVAKAFLCAIEE